MARKCVVLFGPPCSGKTTTLSALIEEQQSWRQLKAHEKAAARLVPLSIGTYIRDSASSAHPEALAEQALEDACASLPPDGILVLDGIKRASHVCMALMVFARHGVQMSVALEIASTFKSGKRGRSDDAMIDMRRKRYEADRPLLVASLQAVTGTAQCFLWRRSAGLARLAHVGIKSDLLGSSLRAIFERIAEQWVNNACNNEDGCPSDFVEKFNRRHPGCCAMCGCASAFDEYGERLCFCATCTNGKGCYSEALSLREAADTNECEHEAVDAKRWLATQLLGIDWKRVGGLPKLELPQLLTQESTLDWLTEPGRYVVSPKCDGERVLLIVQDGWIWLTSRTGKERRWLLAAAATGGTTPLTDDTVMDGEYLASSNRFLAFDLLHLTGRVLLHLPRSIRLQQLQSIGLPAAEAKPFIRVHLQPGTDGIAVHLFPSAPVSVKLAEPLSTGSLNHALSCSAFPCDGLVFSPTELPYGSLHVYKWQPHELIRADLICSYELVYDRIGLVTKVTMSSKTGVYSRADIIFDNIPRELISCAKKAMQAAINGDLNTLSVGRNQCRKLHRFLPTLSKLACAEPASLSHPLSIEQLVEQTKYLLKALGKRLVDSVDLLLGSTDVLAKITGAGAGSIFACRWVDTLLLDRQLDCSLAPSVKFFPVGSGAESHLERNPLTRTRYSSGRSADRPLMCGWLPYQPRRDKAEPNTSATVRGAEMAALSPLLANASALRSIMAARLTGAGFAPAKPFSDPGVHPALARPFSEVVELVSAAVEDGRVERQNIAGTNLMVYNSRVAANSYASDFALEVCRGLVLSPNAVVAAPFCRFHHHSPDSDQIGSNIGENELVEATEKKDGSLIIAFTYKGELITCTKRRADSEQAIWSRSWLHERGVSSKLLPGATYMLEATYRDNAVVVGYKQDECVLLAIRDADGAELDYLSLVLEASRLQLPVIARMRGKASDFHWEAALAKGFESEGWVLKAQRGGGLVREKIVRRAWKAASEMSKVLVRPLAAIHRFGSFDPALAGQLQNRMATHHVREMYRMQEALELVFLKLCRQLGYLLGLSSTVPPNAPWMQPWIETVLNTMAAMVRQLIVEKQHNTESLNAFKRSLTRVIGHLKAERQDDDDHYDSDSDNDENTFLWQSVHHVLCLLVRAACHGAAIPGYTPSVWASATIAKGWAYCVPIEAKGWQNLRPELFDLILAHSPETNASLQLVSRGMRDVVHDSSAASRLKVEAALQRLIRFVDDRDTHSVRSARALLRRQHHHRRRTFSPDYESPDYDSPDYDRGYGSF